MRIACYNLWNSECGMPERAEQIRNEILRVDADVMAMQEVSGEVWQMLYKMKALYPYAVYSQYPGEDEGLAFLSKLPVLSKELIGSAAQHVLLEAPCGTFSVTNVHLPWDSCREREKQIVDIVASIALHRAAQSILLGDFNADMDDSVDRFLRGQQTLFGEEAAPCWCDLARAAASQKGQRPACTLDMLHNPRWAGQKTIYTPSVMDRIYLRDTWDEICLENVYLFGREVSPTTGYAPSDHWGVAAEIEF